MENHRNYYAIIPANVRYDDSLIPSAKLLYGEITALCNEKGYCWASNEYFANQYGVGKSTIQNWLKSLEEKGYIYREVKYKEGSREIEARYIRILGGGNLENRVTPHPEIYQDNNTLFNNTNNILSGSEEPLSSNNQNLEKIPYKKIIDHLNQLTNSKFSYKSSSNQKYIKARWNEGNDLDDFMAVIDLKVDQWINDNDMRKYLRPSTLFSAKNFENYKAESAMRKQAIQPVFDYESDYEAVMKAYEQ